MALWQDKAAAGMQSKMEHDAQQLQQGTSVAGTEGGWTAPCNFVQHRGTVYYASMKHDPEPIHDIVYNV
jgi:hypothetical protein